MSHEDFVKLGVNLYEFRPAVAWMRRTLTNSQSLFVKAGRLDS